ncbi:NPCBM/NEW2 domain-containing protein [Tundrisphaera lichenicola]|uniref:NPCBM/NEW2 domain-containing protein n=1 Tax=Tundrisphaera lichenicola TaxID=2029860 RepID=UPI003EBA5A96
MTGRVATSMPFLWMMTLTLGLAAGPVTPAREFVGDRPAVTPISIPSDPVFNALRTDGSTVSGQIRQLGLKSGLVLARSDAADQTIPIEGLVKLTREGSSAPMTTEGGLVLFPDGDRLARSVIGPVGQFNLDIQQFALGNLAIPIDSILGLILAPPAEPDAVDALVARVRAEPREADLIWLANGDRLPGLFAGMTDKKLAFQPATGKVELDRSGIVALGFEPAQVNYPKPAGPYFELTTVDGSRLGVTDVRMEQGHVIARTRFGAEIRLPVGELAKVHVLDASVVYLSDREADGTQYEPYIGPTRPYRRNANVAGESLRLGGQPFDRGLGTQSRTLLAYKIPPGSKRFQSTVGLDDRAGPLGNVVFKIRADNHEVYTSPPMSHGETPRPVDVDLTGARLLILITEFGERGDVQDHADWIEARIIR